MKQKCVNALVSALSIAGLSLGALPVSASEAALARPDGTALQYRLDIPDAAGKSPLVVVAQGSGCIGARQSAAVRAVVDVFAALPVLTVEAYGVAPDHADPAACSPDFLGKGTMSQRVADYRQVLAALDGAEWWDGRLILFGGSEGGLVMVRLAAEVQAEAAILLSTAPGVGFDQIVLASVPPEGQETVSGLFARARAEPDSLEMFAGYTFRFWADALAAQPIDDMLSSSTRYLVIHGGQDAVPVDYSRLVADRYAAAKRCELTYWELPGLDHGMRDAEGNSQMPSIAAASLSWALSAVDVGDC